MSKYAATCPLCDVHYASTDQFCLKCTYPFSGTDEDKKNFVAQLWNDLGRSPYAKRSKLIARLSLFVVGAVTFYQGMYQFLTNLHQPYGLALFGGALYMVLAWYTAKKPIYTMYTGLTLLIGFYSFSILNQPEVLLNAWPWYTAAFLSLSYSFYAVLRYVPTEL